MEASGLENQAFLVSSGELLLAILAAWDIQDFLENNNLNFEQLGCNHSRIYEYNNKAMMRNLSKLHCRGREYTLCVSIQHLRSNYMYGK